MISQGTLKEISFVIQRINNNRYQWLEKVRDENNNGRDLWGIYRQLSSAVDKETTRHTKKLYMRKFFVIFRNTTIIIDFLQLI